MLVSLFHVRVRDLSANQAAFFGHGIGVSPELVATQRNFEGGE
jgi:hypothetical protein